MVWMVEVSNGDLDMPTRAVSQGRVEKGRQTGGLLLGMGARHPSVNAREESGASKGQATGCSPQAGYTRVPGVWTQAGGQAHRPHCGWFSLNSLGVGACPTRDKWVRHEGTPGDACGLTWCCGGRGPAWSSLPALGSHRVGHD